MTKIITEYLDRQHLDTVKYAQLSNDIELNPGPPPVPLTVITLNCHGLGKIDKFRLLLNKAYNVMKEGEIVIMLQESMIISDDYLKLAWRGKYVLTPGTGNSKGCLTLFSEKIDITSVEHIENRGHLIYIKGLNCSEEVVAVLNLYAPQGFGADKIAYFNNVFDLMNDCAGDIIVGGDFNLTFNDQDRFKRGVTVAENRVAEMVKNHVTSSRLSDIWQGQSGYTWRRGRVMSKLDRIYYRLNTYQCVNVCTDWTFTTSDHAAVFVKFAHKQKKKFFNEHIKLDNDIIKNLDNYNEIKTYLVDQLLTAEGMNPHLKLEFAKMSIRTKALEITKRLKRQSENELKEINDDLLRNMSLLTRYSDANSQAILLNDVEELTRKKDAILQQQGAKLAGWAKTKWYNEGEKSNKYFLNLLKRRASNNEMARLTVDGVDITDESEIRRAVTDYYRKLYNNNENSDIDQSLFQNMFMVDPDYNAMINAPITVGELWANLKNVRATTPGPDGLSNTYIKKFWDILGPLIVAAWNYSIAVGELAPSHKQSLLRLIPKAGKDTSSLKNWRPITLSNCDHKLITRTYNMRLLSAISKHITTTQTAYIKGRNIADNLRLLGAAVRLADVEENIDATVIALDAQKAFDSVQHDYLSEILRRIGLNNFVPIFKLLYNDLSNDIIINGHIGKGYKIGNGVKQGDALSCSLFLLAIEPVIRNITANNNIIPISSNRINYTWPKVLGYADDLTILTQNQDNCVESIFLEYEKLTRASGLKLNADKTEKFNISSRNINNVRDQQNITYNDQLHLLTNTTQIKINGIWFDNDRVVMRRQNYELTLSKMNRHFTEWSKRNLSLLGKTQIIKTFGTSQYLYTLAAMDFELEQWKVINKTLFKFLWNKNYEVAPAPHRIRKDIMLTNVEMGGFGMPNLEATAQALRLRRYNYVLTNNNHPIADLQIALGGRDRLRANPIIDIEDITTSTMKVLNKHFMDTYKNMPNDLVGVDVGLNGLLLNSNIQFVTQKRHLRSRHMTILNRRGVLTVKDVINTNDDSLHKLLNIVHADLQRHIIDLVDRYGNTAIPNEQEGIKIYCTQRLSSISISTLTSKQIRVTMKPDNYLCRTKMLSINEDTAPILYKNIKKVKSVPNRTKLLRLIHGDVYCGSRLKRFNMSDNDRCLRCFAEETISHLLLECPYTQQIWSTLGIQPNNLADIICDLSASELEIAAEIISEIVFRKKVLPPEILIRNIYNSYAGGICRNRTVTLLAQNTMINLNIT